jgi:hypothetical protein
MLASVTDELYGLTPGEFTARRNQHAKDAKARGDKDLAAEITKLPKPSVAAWVINLLARQRPDIVDGVIQLGDALREAQEDFDRERLKDLSRQRQELLRSVATAGADLAESAGHRVPAAASAEVEQTLQAAMADPNAAAAVQSGRLIRTLASTGIEPVDITDAVAGPPVAAPNAPHKPPKKGKQTKSTPAPTSKPPASGRPTSGTRATGDEAVAEPVANRAFQRRVDEARDRLEAAEQQLKEARAQRASADERVSSLTPRREELAAALADLESQIVKVDRELAEVDRAAAAAERERDEADRSLAAAERATREAQQRLERLSG